MSRTDHYVGLKTQACTLVVELRACLQNISIEGAFGNVFPLYKYLMPNGKWYYEGVQESPWAGGPHFFLALVDEGGEWVEDSLWSAEDIGDYLGEPYEFFDEEEDA